MSEIEIFHWFENVDDELVEFLLAEAILQWIVEMRQATIAATAQ